MDLLSQTATKMVPIESARALIKTALPSLTDAQINAILAPLRSFKPPEPKVSDGPKG